MWEMMSAQHVLENNTRKKDATLNWSANELLLMSFRAGESCRVQRVNDNKKVCKWACCCRGFIHNNERGAGKCGVESLMEMSGV